MTPGTDHSGEMSASIQGPVQYPRGPKSIRDADYWYGPGDGGSTSQDED